MNRIITVLVCIFLIGEAYAQKNFEDSIATSRNRTTKDAMIILAAWSTANIASGFIIAGNTSGQAKYTWQMNAYWNIFNLGLAGLGYSGLRKAAAKQYDFYDNYRAQQAIEKLYIFNTGLDLAYIAGGFYLQEKGNNQSDQHKQDQLRGYGTSIAIQGGFLLVMDAVMYILHHKNTKRMSKKWEGLDLRVAPGGLGMVYKF